MKKNRQYTREYTLTQLKELQDKFKVSSGKKRGFLSSNHRKVLLHQKRIGKRTSTTSDSDFYYTIREKAKGALTDYSLITETLTDSQLEEIFSVTKMESDPFTLTSFLEKLFELELVSVALKDIKGKYIENKSFKMPIDQNDLWKALLAERILNICIDFFVDHRYISTQVHAGFLENLRELINVEISRASQLSIHNRVKGIA